VTEPHPERSDVDPNDALRDHVDATVRAEVAREATVRASRIGDDVLAEAGVPPHLRCPPLRLRYPRYGWREAVGIADARRVFNAEPLQL
jgi:hypothetical protein